MKKVKVLIVDDSVVFRSQIRAALEAVDWIEVVGVAANGRIALDKIKQQNVDLLILDLEMPEMNGIQTLQELKNQTIQLKTIVFSSVSNRGAQITLDALSLGASDFVPKPDGSGINHSGDPAQLLRELLLPKIEPLFKDLAVIGSGAKQISNFNWNQFSPKAIVIGCSTGGPTALETIFSKLKGPFLLPVLIVQHMPPVFTASLVARLSKICGVPGAEAVDGEMVLANKLYMAPGDFHMQVVMATDGLRVRLNQGPQECSVRPAVDQLFRSAAQVYRKECLGIVLTGMGKDGLVGGQLLRQQGNPIVIQERKSCVVFGMPGALYDASAYDDIQDLNSISDRLGYYLHYGSSKRQGVG